MKILGRRIVTKASDDGTFEVGDHLYFDEDGTIGHVEAGGWIEVEDVPESIKGMESKPDLDYVRRRKAKLLEELKCLDLIDTQTRSHS
jgi:hypothetical protein